MSQPVAERGSIWGNLKQYFWNDTFQLQVNLQQNNYKQLLGWFPKMCFSDQSDLSTNNVSWGHGYLISQPMEKRGSIWGNMFKKGVLFFIPFEITHFSFSYNYNKITPTISNNVGEIKHFWFAVQFMEPPFNKPRTLNFKTTITPSFSNIHNALTMPFSDPRVNDSVSTWPVNKWKAILIEHNLSHVPEFNLQSNFQLILCKSTVFSVWMSLEFSLKKLFIHKRKTQFTYPHAIKIYLLKNKWQQVN